MFQRNHHPVTQTSSACQYLTTLKVKCMSVLSVCLCVCMFAHIASLVACVKFTYNLQFPLHLSGTQAHSSSHLLKAFLHARLAWLINWATLLPKGTPSFPATNEWSEVGHVWRPCRHWNTLSHPLPLCERKKSSWQNDCAWLLMDNVIAFYNSWISIFTLQRRIGFLLILNCDHANSQ